MDNTWDKQFYSEGQFIGGVDEVGVCDCAGPVVAACVILPNPIDLQRDDLRIFDVNDSKQIPEHYRKKHLEIICDVALAIGIGITTPEELDYLNPFHGVRLAMLRAIAGCATRVGKKPLLPNFLIIDGPAKLPIPIPHKAFPKADTKSLCVAAASVVAKVYRDEIMINLHHQHPQYDWINNKGFPCEKQFQGLDSHGIQFGIHRLKAWPFIDRLPEKSETFRLRRHHWRSATKKRLLGELPVWTTEKASSAVLPE